DAKSNWKIKGRARLPHVGRREVDGDSMLGKRKSGIADRALDAISALANAGVGKAHHREGRQPKGDVDFDVDRAGIDAEDGSRPKAGEHAPVPAKAGAGYCDRFFKGLVDLRRKTLQILPRYGQGELAFPGG